MPALASRRSFRPRAGASAQPGAPRRPRPSSRARRRPSGRPEQGQAAAAATAGAVPALGDTGHPPAYTRGGAGAAARPWRRRGACASAEAALAAPPRAPGDAAVTQEAARRAEVKMAARAPGEPAAGGRGWSCGAVPVAPVALAELGSPCPAPGGEAGREGPAGSRRTVRAVCP